MKQNHDVGVRQELIDIDAPIVPCVEAAGLKIYQKLSCIPESFQFDERTKDDGLYKPHIFGYDSDNVRIMIYKNIILEITVFGNYQGKILGSIGIGSTLEDVERLLGPWEEDDDDQLVVRGLAGLYLEVYWPMWDPAFATKPISEFTVFDPTPDSLWELRWREVNLEGKLEAGTISKTEFSEQMAEVHRLMCRRGFDALLSDSSGS